MRRMRQYLGTSGYCNNLAVLAAQHTFYVLTTGGCVLWRQGV